MPYLQPVPREVRPTYYRLLAFSLLRAPGLAVVGDLAALIAVKSLAAPPWEVALLTASLPVGNLLAVFWSRRITLSSQKTLYIFWPEVVTSLILMAMTFAENSHTYTIGFCAFLLLRTPVLQAHSAILRANYPPQWRSWLLARAIAWSEILIAVSGLIFGWLLEFNAWNYRGILALVGACSLLGAFQARRIRVADEAQKAPQNIGAADYSLRRILSVLRSDRRFRRYEFSFSLFGFANIMTFPILPLFLQNELGIRYSMAGLILVTIPMVIDVVLLPLWGRKLDQHNPLLMRVVFNVVFTLGMVCYPLADSLWVFAVGRALIALVQGGSSLVWILGINYFAKRRDVPLYMGLHQSLTGVRGLIAPFAGIALCRAFNSYRVVFSAAAFIMFLGTLVMIGEVIRELRRTGGKLPSFAEAELESDGRFTT